jgi:hypothetical protein
MLVFLKYLLIKKEVDDLKFKIISNNKIFYSAEITYKKKKIRLRCSYRLTMLPLNKLAELSGTEEKGVFPYKILNKDIKAIVEIEENMFNKQEEYFSFIQKYGKIVNIFDILKEYCINDAIITKKSIIEY